MGLFVLRYGHFPLKASCCQCQSAYGAVFVDLEWVASRTQVGLLGTVFPFVVVTNTRCGSFLLLWSRIPCHASDRYTPKHFTEGSDSWIFRGFLSSILWNSTSYQGLQHTAVLTCSVMSNSATPWTVAHQAPLSMGFSRQEYWSGLPCPPPGDRPNPGIEPRSPASQVDSLLSEPPGKPFSTLATSFLLILNNQHDAIKIMYWWDVLWDFQAVQISSEYIITEGRKVNTALRQKLKCILLSVPQECELFLILSSNWNRQEFIHRTDSYVPQAGSLVNMLHQLYNV